MTDTVKVKLEGVIEHLEREVKIFEKLVAENGEDDFGSTLRYLKRELGHQKNIYNEIYGSEANV